MLLAMLVVKSIYCQMHGLVVKPSIDTTALRPPTSRIFNKINDNKQSTRMYSTSDRQSTH